MFFKGHIIRNPNGYYYADISIDGKRKRYTLKTKNKLEANNNFKKLCSMIDVSNSHINKRTNTDKVRFENTCNPFEKYIEYSVSPSTSNRYITLFRKIVPYLNNRGIIYLEDITPNVLQDFFITLLETLNPKTVNSARLVLNNFFNWAINNGYININPISKTVPAKQLVKPPPEYYTMDELGKIFHYHLNPECWTIKFAKDRHKNTYTRLYPFWLALYSSGMRKGELEHLEWADVDFNNKVIKIVNKQNWQIKNSRPRIIPINKSLETALLLRKKANESDKYVFSAENGDITPENYLLKRLDVLLKDRTYIFDNTKF